MEISLSLLTGRDQYVFGFVRDITERKRADRAKEALLSLGTKLSEVESPLAAARAVFATADQLWQWDAAVLQLYSVERDCLDSVLLIDLVDGERREVPPPYPDSPPPPIMRRIMQNGPELILRTPAETHQSEFVAFGDAERLSASLIYVPLRREGKAVGVLSIQSYAFNAYTPEDLRMLQALADYCGGALERIRAMELLRDAHDKLEQRVQERTAELQAANAALGQSEARLRLALDTSSEQLAQIEAIYQSAPVGLCLLDTDLRYLRINERLAAINGMPAAWHLGRTAREAVPHLAEKSEAICRHLITTGQEVLNLEMEGTTDAQPGVMRSWVTHWTPLKDPNGRVGAISMFVEEITERKRMDQALHEAHDKLEQRVRERTAELQAANAALRDSEERFRSLVNNLNVGVYRNTPGAGGRFLQVNPALARIQGYDSVAEFQKITAAETYEDPREREEFLADLMREGSLVNYEVRLKKKDGTPIYASINATAHRGPTGDVDWIDGVLEDITERKLAQEALHASEERYRTLAESSSDAIFILDRELKVEYVNSTAAALWRRTPAELIGLTQPELFPPQTARHHQELLRDVLETGQPVRRDEPQSFPTGDQWIEIRLAPLYGPHGTVSSVMGVCRDITERKRAEQKLTEALDLNQKMLAAATMGIAAYKATGECIFANEALARSVGGSLSAVLQGNFRCLESWRQSGLLQMADEALDRGEARAGEVYTTTRFGKSIWMDCQMAPFVSNGQPHLLFMGLDITERKRAEEALRRAERLQKALLDNIPDPAWLKDSKGRFLACNDAFAKLHGRRVESVIGSTIFDCAPSVAERFTREDKQVMRTRRSLVSEAPLADAQGQVRWFESIKAPLFNERDEVVGTVGIARETTERKRTEILLQAQRDLGVSLSLTSDLTAALKRLLDLAMQMGGVNSGGVYLLNSATGGMDLAVQHGGSPDFVKAVSHWAPDSPQMRLVRRGRPVFSLYRDLPMEHDAPRQREGLRASAFVPLRHAGQAIGALTLASSLTDEIPRQTRFVIEAIAAQAAGAIARIQAEDERFRLERQILEISDREQARIGQDLHDGLCQQLVSLAFDANSLHRELSRKHRAPAKTARRIARYLDQAITEARQLSRGLFPVRLETEGLPSALEELAKAIRDRFKLRCRFASKGRILVQNSAMATHLYRIAQEAVANAVKHSQARSVSIQLRARPGTLELNIEDDGRGVSAARQAKSTGLGLHIMDYRARTIGGTFRLSRGRCGGTLVSCCVPRQPS